MPAPLLDTDVLSEIIKKENERIEALAFRYLEEHGTYHFSSLTRFEILRGLFYTEATAQVAEFETLCANSEVIPLSDEAVVEAAEIWAHLRRTGQPIGVADVLIGATARVQDREVWTGNAEHFRCIPDLEVLDWREATGQTT